VVAKHDGDGRFWTGRPINADAVLTLFLRMCTKEIAKITGRTYADRRVILLPYYGKSLSPERMAGSDFRPEATKQPFLHMEVYFD